MAGDRRNRHRARAAVGLAGRLLDGEAGPGEPEGALVAALDALGPAELLSFDVLARSWRIGLSRERIAAHPTLRALLSLVSADGHQRERGAREAELTPLTVRLLAIRSLDWVPQVATAALARLDACPVDRLAGALPVADRLVTERVRSDALAELLARRLTDDVLRRAATATDPLARRAAWRRLAGRHAVDAGEVAAGAADADVVVRTWALAASEGLEDQDRLRIARHMTGDASGVVAARALGVLVELEGAAAIEPALTGRSAGVRRAARDWAAVRGVDARATYLARLEHAATDPVALVALAELGDARDAGRFRAMLGDPRARVRTAALRALARVDEPLAREVAVGELRAGVAGRMLWVATDVLRRRSPSPAEVDALRAVALDEGRARSQRLRALAILRPSRWVHLATLLRARSETDDPELAAALDGDAWAWLRHSGRIGHRPVGQVAAELDRLLPTLDAQRRRRIEFILRTAR